MFFVFASKCRLTINHHKNKSKVLYNIVINQYLTACHSENKYIFENMTIKT